MPLQRCRWGPARRPQTAGWIGVLVERTVGLILKHKSDAVRLLATQSSHIQHQTIDATRRIDEIRKAQLLRARARSRQNFGRIQGGLYVVAILRERRASIVDLLIGNMYKGVERKGDTCTS